MEYEDKLNLYVSKKLLQNYEWRDLVFEMDKEIRENLHYDLAPCSNLEFLLEYRKLHLEEYFSPFDTKCFGSDSNFEDQIESEEEFNRVLES